MKTTINKTVLTLTALMSVNAVFANTLPPSYENAQKDGIAFAATENSATKKLANSLPPTPEYKGLANSLPPTPEYKGLANSLPPCIEGKALCRQTIDMPKSMNTRVNMG